MRAGMSSHESAVKGETDDWLTPKEIIDALGPFDLDPCAATARPWPTAAEHYTIADDGLAREWSGLIWCNPPYSNVRLWLERMANHGDGVALIFARTETALFHEFVWSRCSALLFPRGRLYFRRGDGRRADHSRGSGAAGAPSVFVGYGPVAADRLRRAPIAGAFVDRDKLIPVAELPQQLTVFGV